VVGRLYLGTLAFAALAAAVAPSAAQAQPSPAALASQASPDAVDAGDFADPSEVATAPAPTPAAEAAPAATSRSSAAAGAGNGVDRGNDGGEVSEKYLVSQRDADSFLGRFATHVKHLVEQAMSYLGTPYRRGGSSRSGVDCSGLVGAVYGQAGLALPRTAAEQFAKGEKVADNDLRPGDLVFFHNTYKHGISHVGIFIGNGRFIHAAGRRDGVIVSDLARPYYRARFAGARRVAPRVAALGGAAVPGPTAADRGEGGEPVDPPAVTEPAIAAAPSAGP
jgi:cell wall-associated NlpC family hydrolase